VTAPASILASFAQPAARLAMGDAAGAAMGGFEALLAMLNPSLQGAGQTAGEETPALDRPLAEAAEADSDLAALLAGSSAWLAQAMSQAPTTPAVDTPAPDAAGAGAGAPTMPDLPVPGAMTRTDLDAAAELAGDQTTPGPPTLPEGVDTEALASLLQGRNFEAVNASPLAWRKPMTDVATSQLPGRTPVAAGSTAAASLMSATPAPPSAPPAIETAVVAQVLADQVEAAMPPAAEVPAETVAAPAVILPPVDAKAPAAPRKAASADSKAAKVEAPEAKTPEAKAAPAEPAEVAAGEIADDEAAPARLAVEDTEIPAAPARTGETAVQALAARLETVAANATALAAQVRGAPETVAKLAAGILDKLEGQSTKFDLQLDPHGLGKVDVSVEIGSDGKLTAQLGFDSALGLSELRGRAQELRAALEQAGFTLPDNALSFDFSGERGQRQRADTQDSNSDQAGKAFARAMGALDEELAAAPTRYQARRGLDLLI
jgi:hypothetical protein